MTTQKDLQGPFYIELVYEDQQNGANGNIATAFVDGFETERDAWRACADLRRQSTDAHSREGEEVSLIPDQILQAFIARTPVEEVFPFAAA